VHIAVKLLPLARARETADLLYELARATVGQEARALHGVDHERELLEVEGPSRQPVLPWRPLVGLDVHTHVAQGGEVAVDALALAGNPGRLQARHDLGHREPVVVVGFLQQHARQTEEPPALFRDPTHRYSVRLHEVNVISIA